ncbi:MAG: NAD(P)-dependent dehydrogenase (short-subunit alcohol dehydrogenase family) [Candidatus Azotimanducaceae bacterium]|jgi:NAD(P)-dependent dehydrogenase (short-subunit alcohol dehydrogenase family)
MQSLAILITGGSRGIGRALAIHLAALGHRIAITGRDRVALTATHRELPEGSLMLTGDATDEAASADAVMQVMNIWGRVDVLINNAGTYGEGTGFLSASSHAWWRVLETNLKGPMLFMAQALPHMLHQDSGIIINIGSYAAIHPLPGNSAYSASKAALARLTDSVAEEVRDSNVQLFCVSPGLVETDMTRGKPAFENVPIDAWSMPDDICATVQRLLVGDCRALNGRFLHVIDDVDALLASAQKITEEGLFRLQLRKLDGTIG